MCMVNFNDNNNKDEDKKVGSHCFVFYETVEFVAACLAANICLA
jgi:hypothetical protein